MQENQHNGNNPSDKRQIENVVRTPEATALGRGLYWEKIQITPDWAKIVLDQQIDVGKRKDVTAISEYAGMMKNNGWVLNGQPIIFNEAGKLVDGVQRLFAVIQAGTPFESLVIYGVPNASAHTIDQHARRSFQNVLEARGWRNAGALVRVASWLLRYERGEIGLPPSRARRISWLRLDRFIVDYPAVREGVEMVQRAPVATVPALSREIAACFGVHVDKRAETAVFLDDLAYTSPDGVIKDSLRPGQALALQFQQMRAHGVRPRANVSAALTLLALEDHLAGRPGRLYEWKPDYGPVELKKDGRPASWKGTFPPNLGMAHPGFTDGFRPMVAEVGRRELVEEALGEDEFLFHNSPSPLARLMRDSADLAPGEKVEVSIETVTPETARKWLEDFNQRNRRIQKTNVSSFVRDMQEGNWLLNGQTICFSNEGRVLNGQHRLMACSLAGLPVDFILVHGLYEEAFATYDMQARHSVFVDFDDNPLMQEEGPQIDERVAKAAAKLVWEEENGGRRRGILPTTSELMDTIRRHPRLGDGYAQARKMKRIASSGVLTWLIYKIKTEDEAKGETYGDEFIEALHLGANLSSKNPLLRMREEIIYERGLGRARRDAAAHLEQVWRKWSQWRHNLDKKGADKDGGPRPDRSDDSGEGGEPQLFH